VHGRTLVESAEGIKDFFNEISTSRFSRSEMEQMWGWNLVSEAVEKAQ